MFSTRFEAEMRAQKKLQSSQSCTTLFVTVTNAVPESKYTPKPQLRERVTWWMWL